MRQFTTPEQTAKLIDLGFKEPKSFIEGLTFSDSGCAYSIGELIEMLPPKIDGRNLIFERYEELGQWLACYEVCLGVYSMSAELIDALYNMIVKLKEDGVI